MNVSYEGNKLNQDIEGSVAHKYKTVSSVRAMVGNGKEQVGDTSCCPTSPPTPLLARLCLFCSKEEESLRDGGDCYLSISEF